MIFYIKTSERDVNLQVQRRESSVTDLHAQLHPLNKTNL